MPSPGLNSLGTCSESSTPPASILYSLQRTPEVTTIDQTQETVNPNPDQTEHKEGLTDVNKSAPEPGNEKDPSMQVKDADVPWDVVQAQEDLPADVKATAWFMFNGKPVLVCAGGFYGKHEGNLQRLPIKVLVDNI